jgi:hypothetical protein
MNDKCTCGGATVGDIFTCWWCQAWLCEDCWERVGHCGHPEAEAENERCRKVPQPPGHPDHKP